MIKLKATDVLSLPIQERIQLVEDIWDTIAVESDSVELTEHDKRILDERIDNYLNNPAQCSSFDDVFKRIKNIE
ncbi:MAG: addiction module protein [Nitrospirae bacterium]|uniref:addiction module protein n=1 Tax=Candidatus Magnetobacterium casense TaxID=1455061 RepID=UPI00058D84BB|nr:addiction module protein [Candidatus Magnetobacterium casensis]MBF0336326.1 addiction module protein [Nitrospirota bacterium]